MIRIFVLSLWLVGLMAAPALAKNFDEAIVMSLRKQGYDQITVTETFLGRTRITAVNAEGTREIVLNPRTGEILRDLWILAASGDDAARNRVSGNRSYQSAQSGDDRGEDAGDDHKEDHKKEKVEDKDDDKDDDKGDDKGGRDDDRKKSGGDDD